MNTQNERSERFQIVMDPQTKDRPRKLAQRRQVTMGEVVRRLVNDSYARTVKE